MISGLKDDVHKASDSVAEILQDFAAALTCAEYVIWKYKEQGSSVEVDFPLCASAKLESYFKVTTMLNLGVACYTMVCDNLSASCVNLLLRCIFDRRIMKILNPCIANI